MEFSSIVEVIKKPQENSKDYEPSRSAFSPELSPTASNEECVTSPKNAEPVAEKRPRLDIENAWEKVQDVKHDIYNSPSSKPSKPSSSYLEPYSRYSDRYSPLSFYNNDANYKYSYSQSLRNKYQRTSPPPYSYYPSKYLSRRSYLSYYNQQSVYSSHNSLPWSTHKFSTSSSYDPYRHLHKSSRSPSYIPSKPYTCPNQFALFDGKSENLVTKLPEVTSQSQNGCAVCSDKLCSFYYGAIVCNSCRGFFKRALKNSRKYVCLSKRDCSLTKKTRNHCQACRLARCFKVGIKKDGVVEEIQQEKDKKNEEKSLKKRKRSFSYNFSISPIDIKLINEAEMFAIPAVGAFRDHHANPLEELFKCIDEQLMSFSEWARHLPIFKDLPLLDQVRLLQWSWSSLLIASVAYHSPGVAHRLLLNPPASQVDFCQLMSDFMDDVSRLKVDDIEWGCLKAILLFSPDALDLSSTGRVDDIRDMYLSTLLDYTRKNGVPRFSHLLLLLPTVRSISLQAVERFKRISEVDVGGFFMELTNDVSNIEENIIE